MSIKKYSSGLWVTVPYRKYETATDTITSLPKTIIGDGQNISAYTIKGNMTQASQPTPQNPVYPQETGDKTANLLNQDESTQGDGYLANSVVGITNDGREQIVSTPAFFVAEYIPISEGTYYYYSDLYRATGNNAKFMFYNANKEFIGYTERQPVMQEQPVYELSSFSVPVNATYMRMNIDKSSTKNCLYTSQLQSYEPYGYKIPILSNGNTYPIYLSEPIRKIGDSVDTAPSTGTATRYIYKHELTGQETWTRTSVGKMYSSNALNGTPNYLHTLSVVTMACSHYKADINYGNTQHLSLNEISLYGTTGSSPIKEIYIYPDGYATAEDYATYLQQQYANGTPVTIWFIMKTPTTETFTSPSIPTSGTAQTFDVDTTLKPSEVSLTYHGWHEHEDTKYTTP